MASGHPMFAHETTDANLRPIVLAAAALAVVAAVVLAMSVALFHFFVAHPAAAVRDIPPNPMASVTEPFPPLPRIEEHPASELQQLRQMEDRTLSSYGWVDKKTGAVRIPIERAMQLQLQRGFPTRKEAPKR